jgi:hypothetical protein
MAHDETERPSEGGVGKELKRDKGQERGERGLL